MVYTKIIHLFALPIFILGSEYELKLPRYNYETKRKHIIVTNLSYNDYIEISEDHMIKYFNREFLLPTIETYNEVLNEPPESRQNEVQPLNCNYKNLYELAISSFLKTCFKNIKAYTKVDKNTFCNSTCENLSKIICKNHQKFSITNLDAHRDTEVCYKDFLEAVSNNKERFDILFYELTKHFVKDLSEYVGLAFAEFCIYFQLTVNTNVVLDESKLVPWYFITSYNESAPIIFFQIFSESINECPLGTKILVRFHIDPIYLSTNIFTEKELQVKAQNEQKHIELTEANMCTIIEEKMYKHIDDVIFKNLLALRDLFSLVKNKGLEIEIFSSSIEYDLARFFDYYMAQLSALNVVFNDEFSLYFKKNLVILANYFEKIWNITITTCRQFYQNLPSTFFGKHEFCEENPTPSYVIIEPQKHQKNLMKIYYLLKIYEEVLKCVFTDYKKIINAFDDIISLLKTDDIDQKRKKQEELIRILNVSQYKNCDRELRIELQFFRSIFKYNMLLQNCGVANDISSILFNRFSDNVKESIDLLKIYSVYIKKMLNESIFEVKYSEYKTDDHISFVENPKVHDEKDTSENEGEIKNLFYL
ncbi:hypothetical protein EDEG_03758 [Edhazardia aedis USNM 41457]|uniref:Uncharacterized protein n=1 Tax=Edhazardia aedis (strain USNM 41457) TaxID=1003232 RepID=J9DGJ0_EDHAE|nr:hypothetical protein EDEG_03758 [Edhazardia aedis USNM 41457]|eukprot:EJW01715.1 hypothetical protein EDEG_03758 [Edhazardia aedis USNM 41457]